MIVPVLAQTTAENTEKRHMCMWGYLKKALPCNFTDPAYHLCCACARTYTCAHTQSTPRTSPPHSPIQNNRFSDGRNNFFTKSLCQNRAASGLILVSVTLGGLRCNFRQTRKSTYLNQYELSWSWIPLAARECRNRCISQIPSSRQDSSLKGLY